MSLPILGPLAAWRPAPAPAPQLAPAPGPAAAPAAPPTLPAVPPPPGPNHDYWIILAVFGAAAAFVGGAALIIRRFVGRLRGARIIRG